MSAQRKLQGGDAPTTRLKELWPRLDEATKDYWRAQLNSRRTLDNIGEEMNKTFGLQLRHRRQLSEFRQWVADQDEREAERDRMLEDERRLKEQFGDISLDVLRAEVLRRSYARTMARGDFKLGLQTVSAHRCTESVQLSERCYEDSKRSDEERALAVCLQDARKYPEVVVLFKQAFAALRKAKEAK